MMDFTLTGFDAGASEQQGFATARARYATDVLDGHQDQTRTGRRELEDHALLALQERGRRELPEHKAVYN